MAPRASPTHEGGSPRLHSAVVMRFELMLIAFSVLLFFSFLRLEAFLVSLVGSSVSMKART